MIARSMLHRVIDHDPRRQRRSVAWLIQPIRWFQTDAIGHWHIAAGRRRGRRLLAPDLASAVTHIADIELGS